MYLQVYPHAGTPTGVLCQPPRWYPYPWVCTCAETRVCIAGKGYPTGMSAGCALETRGFTHALAYIRVVQGIVIFSSWANRLMCTIQNVCYGYSLWNTMFRANGPLKVA